MPLDNPNTNERTVVIEPPRFDTAAIHIVGMAPYMQHRFSVKAQKMIEAKHRAGSKAGNKRNKEPRDFEDECEAAKYISREGWNGIPASVFRNGAVSACRLIGFKMTLAKLSIFVEADGFDKFDGTPLIRITGEPVMDVRPVRLETGVVSICARPRWDVWSATPKIRWNARQFSAEDVANLIAHVGSSVGIGEGRPDSPNSNGMGFGLFEVRA